MHGVGFLCGSGSIPAPARWRGKTGPADVSAAIHGIDLSDIVFRKDGAAPIKYQPTCPSYGRSGSLPAPFRRSPAEQNLSRPLRQERFISCVLEIVRNVGNAVRTIPFLALWRQGGRSLLLQGDGHPHPLTGPSAASNGMTPYRPPCSAPKPVAINSRPCAPLPATPAAAYASGCPATSADIRSQILSAASLGMEARWHSSIRSQSDGERSRSTALRMSLAESATAVPMPVCV